MKKKNENLRELKKRLKFLVESLDGYSKEKYFPFYLVLFKKKEHPRFRESLSIVGYYIENAWPFGERAQALATLLRRVLRNLKEEVPYWTEFAERTPLPLPSYLEVWVDLIPEKNER